LLEAFDPTRPTLLLLSVLSKVYDENCGMQEVPEALGCFYKSVRISLPIP